MQGGVPRRYPGRTGGNSGKHLKKRKVTSNVQRVAKQRRDQLLPGGCNEQTQDQQEESLGKEVCKNKWPCKGMSSLSLERILAGKGRRSPQPASHPKPRASGFLSDGLRSLPGRHQGKRPAPDKDPRELAPFIDPSPKDSRCQNLLPQTVPKHWLAESSGKLLLRHLSTGASQEQGQGDLPNKEEATSPGKW